MKVFVLAKPAIRKMDVIVGKHGSAVGYVCGITARLNHLVRVVTHGIYRLVSYD